eukprot:scaffold5016_cov118-Isochrysis_galbana.AAC.8
MPTRARASARPPPARSPPSLTSRELSAPSVQEWRVTDSTAAPRSALHRTSAPPPAFPSACGRWRARQARARECMSR